ncbi:hypothetical protein SAMN04489712_111108 [Thermomonospora echinospora]|uniref:Flagellar hook-length control protein FliK n=1 Tax=Thermomonospora echinospora TaxID=1992 RepID=A0A1H6CT87_9ACTN|nr:flagellar hook-length control protein FliK [Thermomonospora echinospora]SEG76007.1 hypothetical protein SAMN04489712_111108 [Thermomonospora echinospora]
MRRLVIITATAAVTASSGLLPAQADVTRTPAPARTGTAGPCPTASGVTVVVDYQELGGATEVRCAPGAQPSGLAALENAGFTVTGTQRWGKAFVCRINGKPTAATEPCIDTPPASAYWSYWHAPNGGSWTYSSLGAGSYVPPQGSWEGWSFSKNKTPTTNPPPRVTPVRP